MLLRFCLSLLLLLTMSLNSQSLANGADDPWQLSKTAESALKNALRKTQRGKYSSAQRVYERALKKDDLSETDRIALRKYLAINYILMREVDKGVNELLALPFGTNQKDANILRQVHSRLMRQKRYKQALALVDAHGMGRSRDDEQRYQDRLTMLTYFAGDDAIFETIKDYARNIPESAYAAEALAALEETENRDATQLARQPPSMPPMATRSGDCLLSVAISPQGRVSRILEADCTEDTFKEASIASVKAYRYLPKLVNGVAVEGYDEDLRVRFTLTNSRGEIIPAKERP